MPKDLLDLHGFKGEDVESAVDSFLMNANSAGLDRVRIMTGKGTGAVQNIVIKYLKLGNFPWAYERLGNGTENRGVLVVFLD